MKKSIVRPLGRIIEFDERSRQYPIRSMIVQDKPKSNYWPCGVHLNQGDHGYCVGFAFAAELAAEPVKVPRVTNKLAISIYQDAYKLGNNTSGEEGTSVISGVKACVARGFYTAFKWAFGFDDSALALSYAGPVALGVNWYEGMDQPDRNGMIRVKGKVRGGHAILANEIDMERERVRLHQSWRLPWGIKGECFLSFKDLDRLLREDGECCVPIGRKL